MMRHVLYFPTLKPFISEEALMAKKVSMAGIFPPIRRRSMRGELDLKALAGNIEKWNKTPINGYVVLGRTVR